MTEIEAAPIVWFAVRLKPRQNGGSRTTVVDAEFETYRDRSGRIRKRRLKNTGKKVFVPELILRRKGFEVFLPVRKDWRVKNRFTKEKELVEYPLLVNWMFVGWPADQARFYELMSMDVVTGVMGSGGRPLQMSHQMICELQRRWQGRVTPAARHRHQRAGMEYEVGETVTVLDGPFADFPGKVLDINGSSARVAMFVFGRDHEIEFAARDIGRLGAN